MKILSDFLKLRKVRGLLRLRFLIAGLLLASGPLLAATPKWEPLKSESTEVKSIVKEADIEIRAGRGTIIVTASKPVQVKVYTILGQLVSRENLPAGTSQLTIPAHGVYIIKSGDLTCKVAL